MKVKWKELIISVLISLGIGALAGALTSNSMELYGKLEKPALSPPGWVFPVVWTILFILMGISAYLIYVSDAEGKDDAIKVYALSLLLNFSWSIVFFRLDAYLLAFLVLIALWLTILIMIRRFYKISPVAAYLQIPYLIWVTFAGYLNLAIYLLNRDFMLL
ncbi:MAG TPA: TspO/MBR family protein [Lachnospiraceae bacterium]|nr:TspO/MBR family protein [Lachnospiraceae bacterium]